MLHLIERFGGDDGTGGDPMRISKPEIIELRDILVNALTLIELDDVTYRLGIQRERIVTGHNWDQIFREVIIHFDNRSRIDELLGAARAVNPTDPALTRFDGKFNRATQFPPEAADEAGVEKIITGLSTLDARSWIEAAARVEHCVCLVGTASGALGTGFLIAPDVVMTNYHVVESFIDGQEDPARLRFTFDFMLTGDGNQPGSGTVFKAGAADWLIDHSPLHPADLTAQSTPVNIPLEAGQLDYAVIRLDRPAGDLPVGGALAPTEGARPRGHLKLPQSRYNFAQKKALLIFHHMRGGPLQLSIDTNSYVDGNTAGTRVFHSTNTDGGSSGSPCFDLNWNLVALHQGYTVVGLKRANRAAPMAAVVELLDKRGALDKISN